MDTIVRPRVTLGVLLRLTVPSQVTRLRKGPLTTKRRLTRRPKTLPSRQLKFATKTAPLRLVGTLVWPSLVPSDGPELQTLPLYRNAALTNLSPN